MNNKYGILINKENKLFLRSKKIYFFMLTLIGFGATMYLLNFVYHKSDGNNVGVYLMTVFNTYNQLLIFTLLSLTLGPVCMEKEDGSWNYYLEKGLTANQLIISKLIFSFIWVVTSLSAIWAIFSINAIYNYNYFEVFELKQLIYVLLILISSGFFTIAFTLFISSFNKKFSVSILITLILWFLITILDVILPSFLGKGFVAPFAQSSYQSSIVSRLLQVNTTNMNFSKLMIPENMEIIKAIASPILTGSILLIITLAMYKRSKQNK